MIVHLAKKIHRQKRGDFMGAIIDFFSALFQMIGNIFHGALWAITELPKMVLTFSSVYAYIPVPILTLLTISITLSITFAIIKLI